jgi:hypothetical protein
MTPKTQTDIVYAETKGNVLQRSWRPLLMFVGILIIFHNYVLFPYLSIFTNKIQLIPIPGGLWGFMSICAGGYIAGRSAEKILKKS